jgi:hypothetical protein
MARPGPPHGAPARPGHRHGLCTSRSGTPPRVTRQGPFAKAHAAAGADAGPFSRNLEFPQRRSRYMDKKGTVQTEYDAQDAGVLSFDITSELTSEITGCLDLVKQLQADFQADAAIVSGLREIELKLQALRFSKEPPEALRTKLDALMVVPIAGEKTIRLDAFRKKAAKAVDSTEAYGDRVKRLVRNTRANILLLLASKPGDDQLTQLLNELINFNFEGGHADLKARMDTLAKNPTLAHYNTRKRAFLVEWLKPFQARLGEAIETMSEERLMEAARQVESIRSMDLKEMAKVSLDNNRDPFRAYNREIHPIMNGRSADFWGSPEVRDEFIAIMNRLITRFSFNFDDRFLLFRTEDEGFIYLVGFADEALEHPIALKDGKYGLTPHLKVFLNRGGTYQEIVAGNYKVNRAAYYRALKTAVVPFFVAIAPLLDLELSEALKSAFDMWL